MHTSEEETTTAHLLVIVRNPLRLVGFFPPSTGYAELSRQMSSHRFKKATVTGSEDGDKWRMMTFITPSAMQAMVILVLRDLA